MTHQSRNLCIMSRSRPAIDLAMSDEAAASTKPEPDLINMVVRDAAVAPKFAGLSEKVLRRYQIFGQIFGAVAGVGFLVWV